MATTSQSTQSDIPTVLIVDDEDLFRDSIRDALESKYPNLQVLEAGNGQEALDQLEESPADVVLTDINMPVMDGFNLLLALRDRKFDGSVITVTAFGNPRLKREIQRCGAFAYVEKPVDLPQLMTLIQETAEKRQRFVDGLSLHGFALLIFQERRDCRLEVSWKGSVGTLAFDHGDLIHAETDSLIGNEAARKILGWDHQAQITLKEASPESPQTITTALETLLLSVSPFDLGEESVNGRRASVESLFDEVAPLTAEESTAAADAEIPSQEKETMMGNVKESLQEAMQIEGALGISLVDYQSGMTLGTAGGGEAINLDIASAGNTAVVRAKLRVMQDLGLDDGIEDILISLGTQYHLIRPLSREPNLFLYFALDRERSNLAMARHRLTAIEQKLEI